MTSNLKMLNTIRKSYSLSKPNLPGVKIIPQNYGSRFLSFQSDQNSELFTQCADNWWNENEEMKALHSMNNLRIPFIRDCLLYQGKGKAKCPKPLEGINILDVGCGAGILSVPLTRLGASVVGIDTNEEVLEVAQTYKNEDPELENLQYLDSPVEDIAELDSLKFDCVVASEVVEHLDNPQQFIHSCTSLLDDEGSLVISTINRNQLSYVLAILVAENVFQVAPKGTHDWNKFITPEELALWIDEGGCHINKIHGMSYIPLMNKWIWSDSIDINYILHATKLPLKNQKCD